MMEAKMDGAVGVAKYIASEERLKQLQTLLQEQENLERHLSRVEQDASHVLRNEEMAQASHARRLQARAEAQDSLQRMQRNPGVSFMGYESPAKRRISDMHKAIAEHSKAVKIARERLELARSAGNRARGCLASARTECSHWHQANGINRDGLHLERMIKETQRMLENVAGNLTEAEIDEAVMRARVQPADAARVRAALRNRPRGELQR